MTLITAKPEFLSSRSKYGDKGMAQAMRNLDALDCRAVPRAAATTLNRVAESIIAKTASSVARELAVPRRLIRARIRLSRARADKVNAKV